MGFEKTVDAPIWGVTTQNTDLRTVAGYSSGGTFTGLKNPLRGSLLWDQGMYVLNNVAVAGGATGGSYTVTVETDALVGYTGLPICRATLGPESTTTVVMDNLHQSKATPLPTHMNILQTAAGGGLTLTCKVLAKQYRGVLGTPGANTSERVLQGNLLRGTSTASQFADDRGMTEDATFTIGTTGTNIGMHRMRLWDTALFWAVSGESASGTHDVDIVASVEGTSVSIASTGIGGAIDIAATGDSASQRIAIANNFYGQCPNPTQIIWTETTAGGISDARIVGLAKGGRGSMAKR